MMRRQADSFGVPYSYKGTSIRDDSLTVITSFNLYRGIPRWCNGKESTWTVQEMQEMQEMRVRSLSQEDPLEEEMATHSRILAWRIPWTEETGRLWSIGLQRIGYN